MIRGEEPHDPFCEMLCGFIIRIVLLVIAIFLLSSFAQPYQRYMDARSISYPDTMGFLGGFLFGVPISFTLFVPTTGSLKNAPRRDKGLFWFGLAWASLLFIIIVAAFATSDSTRTRKHWYFE